MPSTAPGEVRSMRKAARPAAGAVLRAAGSQTICSPSRVCSCAETASESRSLVITQSSSAVAKGPSRSTVLWIMLRAPSSTRSCFARQRRLRGQKRVPLPPARMIGRNSTFGFIGSCPRGVL